jgi:predicted nucleic acid-binding protein
MMQSSAVRPRFTLDTNLLVYSVDQGEAVKRPLAMQILLAAPHFDCWLMLQALSEFYWAISRKRMMPLSEAAAQIDDWLTYFPTASASGGAVQAGVAHAVAGRASYWDALLIATAAEAGCTLILTEDLHDGSTLSGVSIHNPFNPTGGLTARTRQLLGL